MVTALMYGLLFYLSSIDSDPFRESFPNMALNYYFTGLLPPELSVNLFSRLVAICDYLFLSCSFAAKDEADPLETLHDTELGLGFSILTNDILPGAALIYLLAWTWLIANKLLQADFLTLKGD